MPYREIDATALGVLLRSSREIAVLDLRPAQEFGNGAPLHGANVPAAELSSRVRELVPNRHTPIALLDANGGLIAQSASELLELGYTNVQGLAGGLNGNERLPVVPIRIAGPRVISGEVERSFRTPVTTAGELAALRRNGASVIVLDTRSVAEYEREHIPGSFPTPGGEILPRFNALVDSPETHVIVTCAGRSRAVLGAQSLILAGVVSPVSTLDFGTLGWVDAATRSITGQNNLCKPSGPSIWTSQDRHLPRLRKASLLSTQMNYRPGLQMHHEQLTHWTCACPKITSGHICRDQ
jgi:rhodanese-related sulfurtransferase